MRTLIVLLLALPLTAQAQDDGPKATIAVAGPMTGAAAAFGQSIRRGAELALAELNGRGGVRALALRVHDDQGRAQEAANVARKLAADKRIAIVIGHFNSSCSLAARPIYTKAGVVALSPGSTSDAVCPGSPWIFRNVYTNRTAAAGAARYVARVLGLKRVGLLSEKDDYGASVAQGFRDGAKASGLEIVAEASYQRGRTMDFKPAATKLLAGKPQAIFLAGLYNEAALFTKTLRVDLKQPGLPLLGGDGLDSDLFVRIAGPAAEGVMMCTVFHRAPADRASPKEKAFVAAFEKRFGAAPDTWATTTYDAVLLAGEAIRAVGNDRTKIRDHLAGMNTSEKAFEGILGKTWFDADGNCPRPIQVVAWRNGKRQPMPRQLPR